MLAQNRLRMRSNIEFFFEEKSAGEGRNMGIFSRKIARMGRKNESFEKTHRGLRIKMG